MKSLECQICFHEFDECRRRPRILSCGHTFCSICLQSLLKDGKIACPNCKKYHITENIEYININFILEKFLSPDDTSNTVAFDIGYKCKEHFYEQNFFCQTHEEWICRDCTVIKHKPCSHSENCDNENDCKVFTKTEKLDKIKSDKTEKLTRNSETYGKVLKWHINQYDRKVNSKLTLREDLQKRLKKFAEENDFEINVLRKKLDSSRDILSNVQKHRELAKLAHNEMIKAHERNAVEESCKNIDKIITSAVEWAEKEKYNVKEEKKGIADVEINLKEFESLKQRLCDVESLLSDSENEVEDLNCKIAEHESTNNRIQSQLKESKDANLEHQKKLKTKEQFSVDSIDEIRSCNEIIVQLKNKLCNSNRERDSYRKRFESLEKKLDSSVKNCEKCTTSWKDRNKKPVVLTRNVREIRNHLLGWDKEAYLFSKLYNENGVSENYYGQINVYAHNNEDIVLVEAFQKSFSPGSLLLQCPSIIPSLESAEYVYLDIGKMKVRGTSSTLLGSPFGRLCIELTTGPRRKEQMLDLCSAINHSQLKHCNFTVIRNKDRPGELVTCEHYQKIEYNSQNQVICIEKSDVLYRDLENCYREHPICAGNVYGYLDGGVEFSIVTRDNFPCFTRLPLLGKVVSGLHYLQDAVRNHYVETIGIHYHGIGFPTEPINP